MNTARHLTCRMLLVELRNNQLSKCGLACYQAHNSQEEAHACLLNRGANEIAAVECVQGLNRVLEVLKQSHSHEDDSKQVKRNQGETCGTIRCSHRIDETHDQTTLRVRLEVSTDGGVDGRHVVLTCPEESEPGAANNRQQGCRVEHIQDGMCGGANTLGAKQLYLPTDEYETSSPAGREGPADSGPADDECTRDKKAANNTNGDVGKGVFIAFLTLLGRCMVVRVLAVVDGGAVTVAANGCGAVAYLLVGVVHAVAIAVDGADAELLRGTPGVGARLSLLGFGAGCPGLEPSGEEPRDCGEQGDDNRCELVDKLYEFSPIWRNLPRSVWACTGADGLVAVQ